MQHCKKKYLITNTHEKPSLDWPIHNKEVGPGLGQDIEGQQGVIAQDDPHMGLEVSLANCVEPFQLPSLCKSEP